MSARYGLLIAVDYKLYLENVTKRRTKLLGLVNYKESIFGDRHIGVVSVAFTNNLLANNDLRLTHPSVHLITCSNK